MLARWLVGGRPPTNLHDQPRGDWDQWGFLQLLDGRGTHLPRPHPSHETACVFCGDLCRDNDSCLRCEVAGLSLADKGVERLRVGRQVDFCYGEKRHSRGEVKPRNCTGWHDCHSFIVADEDTGQPSIICSRFLLELSATRSARTRTRTRSRTST